MVGNLSPTYGATGGAFVVGRGEVAIRIIGEDSPGAPAAIDWSPKGGEDFLQGSVITVAPGNASGVTTAFLPESRQWVISGSVPAGESRAISLAARNPVRLATDALERTLRERGIALEGGVEIEWETQGAQGADAAVEGEAIAGLSSPPLLEVVHVILDTSQNWMTEQLVRTLGAERGERGSWSEGFRIIEEHLVSAVGVDSLDLHMEDGSGLSAYNLLTPRAIVRLLAHAQMHPWGAHFRTALPTPGRAGGTLAGRLTGLEGRVHAKTGTIMNVNSLSGYLITDGGDELLFSILTNGSGLPAAMVRERMDTLVREMAAER